jgi:photosystem II stability/assembly factor-like uncharacterized protein
VVGRTDLDHVAYWVFRTSDGAKHWTVQTSGSVEDAVPGIALRFFDARHGYFVIGRHAALATADGGTTWRALRLPRRFEVELSFADPAHAWFAGTDDINSAEGGPYPFYATSDGGSTWTQLSAPPGGGFAFRDALDGWAATWTEAGGVAYATHDGGRTWIRHLLPLVLSRDGKGGGYTTVRLLPRHGIFVTTGTFAFTSLDEGDTWLPVTSPATVGDEDIAFQDATHWWAMPSGDLFKTSDAGQTWTHVVLQFDEWLYRLQVLDARHAWAELDPPIPNTAPSRGRGLAFTSDGGVHWTYAAVPRLPA